MVVTCRQVNKIMYNNFKQAVGPGVLQTDLQHLQRPSAVADRLSVQTFSSCVVSQQCKLDNKIQIQHQYSFFNN